MASGSPFSSSATPQWDEVASMSLDLPVGKDFGLIRLDSTKSVKSISGPSPSLQAMVVFNFENGEESRALFARDMDPRRLSSGAYRPTRGTWKMSFGFGLPSDGKDMSIEEAIFDPNFSVDVSTYGLMNIIKPYARVLPYAYATRGSGWGPVLTAVVLVTMPSGPNAVTLIKPVNDSEHIDSHFLKTVDFNPRSEMSERFQTFHLIKVSAVPHTADVGAVYDSSKLEKGFVEPFGEMEFWDEAQARAALFPKILTSTSF